MNCGEPMRFSLTTKHTIFLTLAVFAMLLGSYIISARVVRTGLTELLTQRLIYAERSLVHYASFRELNRSNELHTLMSSPRFAAAIATADSGTIAAESPDYIRLVNADLFVVSDPSGELVFSNAQANPSAPILAALSNPKIQDTIIVENLESFIRETVISEVITSDGFVIGRVALGFRLSEQLLDDLKQLTGFETLLSLNDQLLGATESELTDRLTQSGDWKNLVSGAWSDAEQTEVRGDNVLYMSVPLVSPNVVVTFVTSVDDHIAPILNSQSEMMLTLDFVALCIMVTGIYFYTRSHLGRQINYLVGVTNRISEGKMDFTIQSTAKDEFGYLAGKLESMRSTLLQNRIDLEQAHADQMRAERLAGIGQLATGIIHDFKNPMGVIRMSAELASEKNDDPARVTRYSSTIRNQVDRMTNLCQDILDYARGKSNLSRSQVPIDEFLSFVVSVRRIELEKRGVTLTVIGTESIEISVDSSKLQRVIDNLITNALEVLSRDGAITISYRTSGVDLSLWVEDNGPGITSEIAENLFEPFVTSGKKTGTGLGLAICHKIVTDHGGTIKVEATETGGARFVIDLPGAACQDGHALSQSIPQGAKT